MDLKHTIFIIFLWIGIWETMQILVNMFIKTDMKKLYFFLILTVISIIKLKFD